MRGRDVTGKEEQWTKDRKNVRSSRGVRESGVPETCPTKETDLRRRGRGEGFRPTMTNRKSRLESVIKESFRDWVVRSDLGCSI